MEYEDTGRYIPIIFLLHSWGSLFGVPIKVPLVLRFRVAALTATYILPFIYAHAKVVPHICVIPKSPCSYIVSTWGPRGFLHSGPAFIIYSYMEQP